MFEIKVPDLAESISEGTISRWLKNVGEMIQEGEPIVELETDKVNLEVPATGTGVLKEALKQKGETVKVGEVIALLDENATAAPQSAVTTTPAKTPDVQQAAAPAPVKQPDGQAAPQPAAVVPPAAAALSQAAGERTIPSASPAARKLARERGLDLHQIQPLDPLGRIGQDDVKNYTAEERKPQISRPVESGPSGQIGGQGGKPVERRPMSRRRLTIANRLVEAQHTAAMLTTFNEVDMTAILDLRKRRKDKFNEKFSVKLGFMSFFIKAVVGALKEFPLLNAEIQGEDILVKKFYDIGVAVAAKEGLVVPVVRDADRLGFAGIERSVAELAERARSNSLKLEDLQGGTFTITNGGIFGSLLSTPILNAPQVGILGMHTVQLRPVAIDQERMENRPMMYIALSYDHRIVDGSEAVSFLVKVKQLLEDPETLLLEG